MFIADDFLICFPCAVTKAIPLDSGILINWMGLELSSSYSKGEKSPESWEHPVRAGANLSGHICSIHQSRGTQLRWRHTDVQKTKRQRQFKTQKTKCVPWNPASKRSPIQVGTELRLLSICEKFLKPSRVCTDRTRCLLLGDEAMGHSLPHDPLTPDLQRSCTCMWGPRS